MKEVISALHVIAPMGFEASKRSLLSPVYRETNVSPERKYINQRLNSKIFFTEQISTLPLDKNKSVEDRTIPIREIIEKQNAKKSMQIQKIDPATNKYNIASNQSGTPNNAL